MTPNQPYTDVHVNELEIGDVISFAFPDGGYDTATITKIEPLPARDAMQATCLKVTATRPYIIVDPDLSRLQQAAAFSIGFEEVALLSTDNRTVRRLRQSGIARHQQAVSQRYEEERILKGEIKDLSRKVNDLVGRMQQIHAVTTGGLR